MGPRCSPCSTVVVARPAAVPSDHPSGGHREPTTLCRHAGTCVPRCHDGRVTPVPALPFIDRQISEVRSDLQDLRVPLETWEHVASSIHDEVARLDERDVFLLKARLMVAPEDYLLEMAAFQAWMDIAHQNSTNPVVVRAQVMTQLYVGFVWLRDSLLAPVSGVVPAGCVSQHAIEFLSSGDRRRLRNAVAHGRWRYQQDFRSLECWDGQPTPTRFNVQADEFKAWQLLSRGVSIAVLLALTEA